MQRHAEQLAVNLNTFNNRNIDFKETVKRISERFSCLQPQSTYLRNKSNPMISNSLKPPQSLKNYADVVDDVIDSNNSKDHNKSAMQYFNSKESNYQKKIPESFFDSKGSRIKVREILKSVPWSDDEGGASPRNMWMYRAKNKEYNQLYLL